jgi:hypothetical protein
MISYYYRKEFNYGRGSDRFDVSKINCIILDQPKNNRYKIKIEGFSRNGDLTPGMIITVFTKNVEPAPGCGFPKITPPEPLDIDPWYTKYENMF